MLHGEHAARREVVQALDRSLTTSLQARRGMRSDEFDRLENLRAFLNDSAELLHLPQPLLGNRTLREVHEQLAALHDAPSVRGSPEPDAHRGEEVLDEYNGLAEVFLSLVERWHVSSADFAWQDFSAARFTADDHGYVVGILSRLEAALADLEETSGAVATSLALNRPSSVVDTRRVATIGDHLFAAPAIEPHWLDSEPTELSRAVEDAQDAYKSEAEALTAFREEFPARKISEFEPHLAAQVDERERRVRQAVGWASAWDTNLEKLRECRRAIQQLPGAIKLVTEQARACAARLGQPAEGFTEARLGALIELGELSFRAENRPFVEWLVPAGLGRAKAALEEVADHLRDYQGRREQLLNNYSEEVLELDAGAMRQRFVDEYTSVFSKLSSNYRQDARAVKAVRKDWKVPPSIADDLAVVIHAQRSGQAIDAAGPRMEAALGPYYAGRLTDVDRVSAAIEVAERVHAVSESWADLETLDRAVGTHSHGDPVIAQLAEQLRSATTELSRLLLTVDEFVEHPPKLFTGTLPELSSSLAEVLPPVADLAEAISELDRGARHPAGGIAETRRRAQVIADLHAAEAAIRDRAESWRRTLGERFAGARTNFAGVGEAAAWLNRLIDLVGPTLPQPIRTTLVQADRRWPALEPLRNAHERVATEADNLTLLFEEPRAAYLRAVFDEGAFEQARALVGALSESVDQLYDWTEWRAWRERARERGWGQFLKSLAESRVDERGVIRAFQRAYWMRRLERLFHEEPELAEDLRGGAFQRWVRDFCELDERLVRTGADRLIAGREGSRTDHVAMPGSEVDLLRREARKKRRHLPVRALLSRIPGLLSELKPCLMMSPLTVSHFLAPGHTFDLVVFDEASQVPPQDAVNCIYRGKQLVVAGDSKQLPPTPFFQIAELDELSPDEEDARTEEDMESILDSCESLLPSHSLRWHYRSRAEPLIAFSNRHIYNDSLVTFPAPDGGSRLKGVTFTHVPDGQYDRGRSATNRREAEIVADRVRHYLTDGTGRSVGVIAFNTAQATAIAEELDALRVREPSLEDRFRGDRLDSVFVKHLESVQGDERDTIVFSVGYGPDAQGKFLMNFGPLNKEGGERRLNVAVTRAREKVDLVSSVRASDFTLSDGASAGARLLRNYIAYAETGGTATVPEVSEESVPADERFPSPFEEDIAKVISDLGYEPVPDFGLGSFRIDLAVRSRGPRPEFVLAIECDGESYARTPTARDRERLRHQVLAALGWGPIHRIWSLDWVRNRAAEIQRLKEAIQAAVNQRGQSDGPSDAPADDGHPNGAPTTEGDMQEEDSPRERVERIVHELDRSSAAVELPWTTTYRRCELRRHSSYYEFHETVNRREQTDMLIELLNVEAPVSIDYAIRRLADAWGLQRAGHRVAAAGRQAIGQAVRRGGVEVRGDFIWLSGRTLTDVRVPDPADPSTRRDIEDIPPEEIDLVLARLLEATPGAETDQLVAQAARVLGFDRTGGRIKAVLGERVTHLRGQRAGR